MNSRRSFLKKASATAGAMALGPFISEAMLHQWRDKENYLAALSPGDITSDEDFWAWVRQSYTTSSTIINLNNGGVSPQPKVVQDAHIRMYQYSNEAPSYYMWRQLNDGREPLRHKLALLAGCHEEEIAINRNTTEGLNTVIFGLNLKAGDEVVLTRYDYPNMMNAWKQREKRDQIKLNWVYPTLPFNDDDYIVNLFAKAITPKTKVVHITHMINWNGQLLPVKKIADMAHGKGCEVIVDAAHTFAQIAFTLPETGADYLATSLHKWLGAPFGSGLLYIRRDKIKNVWALLSSEKPDGDDIRKFESLGTRSFASEMAIANAVDFHNLIGAARKEKRLRYLKDYWCNKVKDVPGITLNTSLNPVYSCALAHVSIAGWKGTDPESWLWQNRHIHCVSIAYEKLDGIRITPNVYTSTEDLDVLVDGLTWLAKNPKQK